jgi:hypothetical protein
MNTAERPVIFESSRDFRQRRRIIREGDSRSRMSRTGCISTREMQRPSWKFLHRKRETCDSQQAQLAHAGLTLHEFMNVMHYGQDQQHPGRILQGMPWPVFGKKTDYELQAIYEYLRAIPSLPNKRCARPRSAQPQTYSPLRRRIKALRRAEDLSDDVLAAIEGGLSKVALADSIEGAEARPQITR